MTEPCATAMIDQGRAWWLLAYAALETRFMEVTCTGLGSTELDFYDDAAYQILHILNGHE